MKPSERLLEHFAMHPLTADERVTTESMLQDPSSRLLVMPTHHINELGDMMGFRFTCNAHAPGNHLPIVRTMFHGHTLVESRADEAQIMQLMSQPEKNRECMQAFLRRVEAECVAASLDCVPENASSQTRHGTLEATGLLTVDSQHWTPEVPDRIGVYHAYIRGFNRDVRTHRLFIVCSGGMARASDAFCNLVIDAGKNCTAQVQRAPPLRRPARGLSLTQAPTTGNLRLTGGVVAAQGVPARAVPPDQGPGGRLPDPSARRAGPFSLSWPCRAWEAGGRPRCPPWRRSVETGPAASRGAGG
jgi:hypothetical protein